jgi:hypothetical protein
MALIGGGMVWGFGYLHDHGAFKPAPAPPANASVSPHGMGKVIDRTK